MAEVVAKIIEPMLIEEFIHPVDNMQQLLQPSRSKEFAKLLLDSLPQEWLWCFRIGTINEIFKPELTQQSIVISEDNFWTAHTNV